MAGFLNLTVLLAVFSVLSYSPVQPANLFSAFSSGFGPQEEISYTLVRKGDGFEERLYPSKNWICTRQKGGYSEGDQLEVFFRLFGYLDRENNQSRKLDMGIPVSIEYNETPTENTFTACFFMEEKDQANYPAPTNTEVSIIQRPEMTIYTRKFGGYATSESDWKTEATKLQAILNDNGISIKTNIMYWNAYNAPFKFWNRRNEVWLVKE